MRSVDGCTTAAAIGDVIALLPLWTFLLLQRRVPAVAYVFLFPVFLWFLLGGFNLEGNMQAEDELSEETQVWLQQVEDEQHAIMALGFVKGVAFYYGETANLCKVMATLWCCWSGGKLKRVTVAHMCEHVCTCVSMCEHAVIYRFGVLFRYAVRASQNPVSTSTGSP